MGRVECKMFVSHWEKTRKGLTGYFWKVAESDMDWEDSRCISWGREGNGI